MPIEPRHVANAERSRTIYLDNLRPAEAAQDWLFAKRSARRQVAQALRASAYLTDFQAALEASGEHMTVFRQMLAPPLSQDQFKLVCPAWNKGSEKTGAPLAAATAAEVAETIAARLDRSLLLRPAPNVRNERAGWKTVLRIMSTMLAVQQVATARRARLATEQEYAVVHQLLDDGWTQLPSRLIDVRAAIPPKSFMHKTRFSTATTSAQEVDVACGLKGSYVLAMECKVTNDETNSVKRINDVLKKAGAWRFHWGSFVATAALLQGVIAPKDVQRLTDAGVEVFWSHDLAEFHAWLHARLG